MRDLFILSIVFGFIPLAFYMPHIGVYIWSWISYMNPHRLAYGAAFEFPLAYVVGLATMIAWLVSKEPKRLPKHPLVALLIVWLVWTSITAIFALNPDGDSRWEYGAKIILFTLVTIGLITTKNRLVALIWVICISLGFYGVKGGMFTILGGGKDRVWGPLSSFIGDNNQLAMALVMIIPLLRFLQLQTDNKWIRLALTGGILVQIFAIFGTQSRSALLAISAMLIFFVLRSRRKTFAMFAAAVSLAIGLLFMPQSWTDRMMTIQSYEEDSSATGRLEQWDFATRLALDRPILGGGRNVFDHKETQDQYLSPEVTRRNVHSIYFESLGEHGFPGLFIFLAIGIVTFFSGGRIGKLVKGRPDLAWAGDLGAMCQVSVIGYAVSGAFLNLARFDLYYHIVAIVVITSAIVAEALKRAPAATAAKTLSPDSGGKSKHIPGGGVGSAV